MKRPQLIALYKTASVTPSAATDQKILAMARARNESRHATIFAMAAGLALIAIFAARWMMPASTAPEIVHTDFGLEEGQARAWLTTYQPTLTATGPGSREGLQP